MSDAFFFFLVGLTIAVGVVLVFLLVASRKRGSRSKSLGSVDSPSSEQLQQLKQTLNLQKGSLVFKKGSVYHVIYQNKKHVWNRLGSWSDLKQPQTEVTLQPANPCRLFAEMGKGYVGFLKKEWNKATDLAYPPTCFPSPSNPKGCESFFKCVGIEK